MPIYSTQRLVIQNIPMHQTCFCCQHCRRNLSLLNYSVFQGAFYCKVCSKLLAEVIGKRTPNTTLSPNHQQLLLKGTQPNPRQESKTKSGPTGRILAREKMPQRPSNLHLQDNQSTVTSQDKLKTICSPLKKGAKNYICRKHERCGTKETQPQDLPIVLQRSDRSCHKTWVDNSTSESFGEQKKSQLPRVIGPKCGDQVLHWIKKIYGSQEQEALESRQLFGDERIVGIQVGTKIGSRILEKARRFQSNTSEVERSTSKVTPLSLNLQRSSLGGPFLSSEGALRHTTVTPAAATLCAPQLAKNHSQGKKPGEDSSWKITSDGKNPRQVAIPLPKGRTMLPALVPPLEQRSKKKLQKTSQENTLDMLETKDVDEPNYNTMVAPLKNTETSQSMPEGLVSSPGHEEKKNDQTEHCEKPCLKTNQKPKASWMSRNEFLGEVTEILPPEERPSMDYQLSPETLPLNEEDKKNEMSPRGISDKFVTLTCFSVSLDTEAIGRTSSSATDGNIEDGSSLSNSQADDVENGEVLSRNSLQEHATLTRNTEPEIKNTNEKLQAKASSGPNLELPFQEDTSRDISLLSSAKDPEILPSCEVPHLIEKQETGHVTMEIKAEHESVPAIKTSQDIIAKSSRKQLLKKNNDPFAQFFASKTQRSIPSQKPISGTKKTPKAQSALLTLFGHSVNKDKSQKEWPRKDLGELSGKVNLQSTHFSSLSKPDFPKKDKNSGVVLQTRNSEAGPQVSEVTHRIGSKGNQSRNSPPLDSLTVSLELGREISSPTRMQSRSKCLDVPRQSNTKHAAEEPEKSLPLTSSQSCEISTENMSQCSANTSVETSVSCRNILSEQELDNVNSQDLELKARNVSLLDPLAKGETQALDEENWVPDRLSTFKGTEVSARTEEENVESSPGSDTGLVPMIGHFCSGSSENFLGLSHPQFTELEPNMMIKENSQLPESGNFQALESNSDHPFELTLHVEQTTNENYSIKEDHFHPVLIPSQSMPELLRDTLQSKATGRSAEVTSPPEDQI
ncbi:uncharacterized protein LOC131198709 [Ahaetulla prasina]|uniref:uncharacterized protein LOC131198709 n=1 Tax=Ahaetulla prasina TaxID=499056 RepID=UPI002649B985|nr:uncharacterized protein LOC131198709 [Ahaetulla prasina]